MPSSACTPACRRTCRPSCWCSGNPAGARGVNIEGLKRRGFTPSPDRRLRAAYKHIYRSNLTLEEAKAALADAGSRHAGRRPRASAPCATSSATPPVASSADVDALPLVAGEVSGDMLAARLLAGLRRTARTRASTASAAPRMIEHGFVGPADGNTDGARPVRNHPALSRDQGIQNRLRDRLLAERPAAFIGADYPGFQPRAGRAAEARRHSDHAFHRSADLGLARRPHQEDRSGRSRTCW